MLIFLKAKTFKLNVKMKKKKITVNAYSIPKKKKKMPNYINVRQ